MRKRTLNEIDADLTDQFLDRQRNTLCVWDKTHYHRVFLSKPRVADIAEDFPEGKRILLRLLSETRDDILRLEKVIIDLYNNTSYDIFTRKFLEMAVVFLYLDPLLMKQKKYRHDLSFYLTDSPAHAVNKDEIKNIPIETLFDMQKPRRSSSRTSCLCPLHREKTPSFVIYHASNTYVCFGCQAKGDVIDFVMRYHKKTFSEALQFLSHI